MPDPHEPDREAKEAGPRFECPLCGHEYPIAQMSDHHLVPASRGGKVEHKVLLCNNCHRQIHALFTNRELETTLNSVAALKAAGPMRRYLGWARKRKPSGKIRTRSSHRRRAKGRKR